MDSIQINADVLHMGEVLKKIVKETKHEVVAVGILSCVSSFSC